MRNSWNEMKSRLTKVYIVALCLFVDENTLFNVVPTKTWEHRKNYEPHTCIHIRTSKILFRRISLGLDVYQLISQIHPMHIFLLDQKKFTYATKETIYENTADCCMAFFFSHTHCGILYSYWIHKRTFSINLSH